MATLYMRGSRPSREVREILEAAGIGYRVRRRDLGFPDYPALSFGPTTRVLIGEDAIRKHAAVYKNVYGQN